MKIGAWEEQYSEWTESQGGEEGWLSGSAELHFYRPTCQNVPIPRLCLLLSPTISWGKYQTALTL